MAPNQPSGQKARLDNFLTGLKQLDLEGHLDYNDPRLPVAQGGFGEVYKGRYRRSDEELVIVAIKRLKIYLDGSRDTTKIFRREVRVWSRLNHPNVLPLLGYVLHVTETSGLSLVEPSLVSEWMNNGDILHFIARNPGCNLVKLSLGMADGLTYLHEKDVIHADLKSANVLVSEVGEAVICDFGASRLLQAPGVTSSLSGTRGTSRWLACELLARAETYPKPTKESDVWAFGMTVYELMTNGCPYAEIQIEAQVLVSIMIRKLPSTPTDLNIGWRSQLWNICKKCWTYDPTRRPTMITVSYQIENILNDPHASVVRSRSPPILDDSYSVNDTVDGRSSLESLDLENVFYEDLENRPRTLVRWSGSDEPLHNPGESMNLVDRLPEDLANETTRGRPRNRFELRVPSIDLRKPIASHPRQLSRTQLGRLSKRKSAQSLPDSGSSLYNHSNKATRSNILSAPSSTRKQEWREFVATEKDDWRAYQHPMVPSTTRMAMKEANEPGVARYSFDGAGEGELPLDKGQSVEILNDRDPNWWYVRDPESGQEGLVPATFLM